MAKDDKYFLTDADRELLRQVIDREKVRQLNTRNRPMVPEEQSTAPEVYVALTPAGGIPALVDLDPVGTGTGTGFGPSDNMPGVAECLIYQVLQNYPGPTPYLVKVSNLVLPVYNITSSKVPEKIYVTVNRDKFGSWIVQPQATMTYVQLAETVITTPFAAGIQTVTPANMFGIQVGSILIIDTYPTASVSSEWVAVTAVTSTTFTAKFALAHNSGSPVPVRFAPDQANTDPIQGALWPGQIVSYNPAGNFNSGQLYPTWDFETTNVWLSSGNIGMGNNIAPRVQFLNYDLLAPVHVYQATPVGANWTDGKPIYNVSPAPPPFIGRTVNVASQTVANNTLTTLTLTGGGSLNLSGAYYDQFFDASNPTYLTPPGGSICLASIGVTFDVTNSTGFLRSAYVELHNSLVDTAKLTLNGMIASGGASTLFLTASLPMFHFAAAPKINLKLWQNSGGNATVSQANSWLSIYQLAPFLAPNTSTI